MSEQEHAITAISKDEIILTKFFAFGIKDLKTINQILSKLEEDSFDDSRISYSQKMELAINEHYMKENVRSERKLVQETIEIFLSREESIDRKQVKENTMKLDKFGSPTLNIGRMGPPKIDFSKKEWMVFEKWSEFDPLVTIITSTFWIIIYYLIIKYFYL